MFAVIGAERTPSTVKVRVFKSQVGLPRERQREMLSRGVIELARTANSENRSKEAFSDVFGIYEMRHYRIRY